MIVRIQKAIIRGIKNVEYGEMSFPCSLKEDIFGNTADVTGIYGQNGSGKSAFIFSLAALKMLLSGRALPSDTAEHILFGKDMAGIRFEFSVTDKERFFLVNYEAVIRKCQKKEKQDGLKSSGACISAESITAKERIGMKYTRGHIVLACREEEESGTYRISPGVKRNRIEKAGGTTLEAVFQKANESGVSVLFSDEIRRWGEESGKENAKEDFDVCILNALYQYGSSTLYIIDNRESGLINANYALPFGINVKEEGQAAMYTIPIHLTEPSVFSAKWFHLIEEKIENMNAVLSEIIPGLRVVLKETGKEHTESGAEQIITELEAERDGRRIPLRYESDGIKKIISVLHMLIAMYNNPSMTLAIDELDSGIFEYLLGEILKVIKESGKGQLIFTSHNLRPLETLNKDCIIFTTANPKNRYIRLKTKKGQNNLRNVYFHDIILGGQKECIYEPTSSYSISRVFRMAGETYAK
ncbi:MAG: ATP-binding protein [Lachnospiraceae bacterium]|nr:ATP-binding protein [Lachnospiraceae bacterium]